MFICCVITITLSAQSFDNLNKDLLADAPKEFWINCNFTYVSEIMGHFVNDDSLMDYLENEEKTVAFLYAGLAGIKGANSNNQIGGWLEKAKELAVETYGRYSMYEGMAMLGLGAFYLESDGKKAIQYEKAALEILRIACGENALETAVAEEQLAYHLTLSGVVDEADKAFQSAESRFKKGNLTHSLWYARLLTERAVLRVMEKHKETALSDLEAAVDILNPLMAAYNSDNRDLNPQETFIYYLGITVYVYNSTGFFKEAIEVGQTALKLMEKMGINTSSDYAAAMCNIGTSYILLKDYKSATRWYQKAREHYETIGKTEEKGYQNAVNAINWLAVQK